MQARDPMKRNGALCQEDLSSVFASVKRAKRAKAGNITKLTVSDKVYCGDQVKDGFFDSISKLKTRDQRLLDSSQYFNEFALD